MQTFVLTTGGELQLAIIRFSCSSTDLPGVLRWLSRFLGLFLPVYCFVDSTLLAFTTYFGCAFFVPTGNGAIPIGGHPASFTWRHNVLHCGILFCVPCLVKKKALLSIKNITFIIKHLWPLKSGCSNHNSRFILQAKVRFTFLINESEPRLENMSRSSPKISKQPVILINFASSQQDSAQVDARCQIYSNGS